jgi:hypothetical protein
VSNIAIAVNGNTSGDGFLIAPDDGVIFNVPLNLSTTDGSTVNATVDATPNGAGIALPGGNVSIGPGGMTISIAAAKASGAKGDSVINVRVGGGIVASFVLTAINRPELWFKGRFEVRFATDNDWYNDPKGTWGAGNDGVNPLGFGSQGPGYTFWLEGEPLFAPANPVDSVPTSTDKPVGRVIRFNNPVAPRSHAGPVVTTVDGIRGALSNGTLVYFTAGDPVIGAPVNLGPNTYLAQNWEVNPNDAAMGLIPAEQQAGGDTREPMALFEFHIDGFFSGNPASDADRPKSSGFGGWADDPNSPIPTQAGIPAFAAFNAQRLAQLQHDFNQLSAADQTGTPLGRNLKRRIDHLTGANGRPQSYQEAWEGQEEYVNGRVNDAVAISPNGSSVMSFYAGYTAFDYYNKLHTFHSDELNGYVYGRLTVNAAARVIKTCSLQIQNSTFGKDELISLSLPATFPSAFWVVLDGFFPSELGIDANDNLTNPPNPPAVNFTVDPTNASAPAIANALQTQGQLKILPFAGAVLTASLPPLNAPQRILYPFTVQFTGTDGFIDQTETLTLTATITVNGKNYSASAPLELTTAANPFVRDADAGNQYTSWLSTDLRVFRVDDDEVLFGKSVSDFYPPGAVAASYPVSAAAASAAATGYISDLIQRLTPSGQAEGNTFEDDLSELEDASRSQLEYVQVNPRSGRAAFNFAICRVRIRGTTPPNPPPPFTTQAPNCRVFFRAFQAQTTVSTFQPQTTYRSTPVGVPNVTPRVPLLGVQTDSGGHDEVVTVPFFAVQRVNLAAPADLTTQPPDSPNVQTISPMTGTEVDTYYGVWLDINQPSPLFPQFVTPGDFDNKTGYFGSAGFAIQSINAAFNRAPHQCLIAEIAFDDIPTPTNADSSTSDKLAQRNLAYVDGPNPGVIASRRMPHPFQVRASPPEATNVDELMITWGNTPPGTAAEVYLPGISATDIITLADELYPRHSLTAPDPQTIVTPTGPVTFIPIPKAAGFLAGLLTVDLPAGVQRGDAYTIVVRQLTDAVRLTQVKIPGGRGDVIARPVHNNLRAARKTVPQLQRWRRVLGAFQLNIDISTKQQILEPEEHRLALFRWIADQVLPENRWHLVMRRYADQLAGRVNGFGGNAGQIPPSPSGRVPGFPPRCRGIEPRCDREEVSGKVRAIAFDHFGDFEGFVLENCLGELHRFYSGETRMLEVVRDAMERRAWVTVVREPKERDRVLTVILSQRPL